MTKAKSKKSNIPSQKKLHNIFQWGLETLIARYLHEKGVTAEEWHKNWKKLDSGAYSLPTPIVNEIYNHLSSADRFNDMCSSRSTNSFVIILDKIPLISDEMFELLAKNL